MSSTATLTPYFQPQLPLHFANQLLDCQIQLQLNTQHISPQIIMKLVELYRIGTEYYQSIRSYKYLYFQRKMNSIVKSDTILNSLNHNNAVKCKILGEQQQQKPNVVIIQSLTDFKKQQVTLTHHTQNHNHQKQSPQSINFTQSKKPSTPFKRHLEQKFQSKQHQQQRTIYQNPQVTKQKQQRQHQLRLLAKLQHKQKQQQLNMKISTLQPDKQMKKFIDTENKKMQQLSNIIGKVVQSQQQEFMKKLQQRRERIKSNTEKKKRMTKSFSDNSNYWTGSNSNDIVSRTNEKVMIQSQDKSEQNCQSPLMNVQIENPVDKSKRRHNVPSTRLFSSFIVENNSNKLDNDYGDDIVFQQVARQ